MQLSSRVSDLARRVAILAEGQDEGTQQQLSNIKSALRGVAVQLAPLEAYLKTAPEDSEDSHERAGN